MKEQLAYYGLSTADYQDWLGVTLQQDKQAYFLKTNKAILKKIDELNAGTDKKLWPKKVMGFMYRVQSLRTRFGQLGLRMENNLATYAKIIQYYNSDTKYPEELKSKISTLANPLQELQTIFNVQFSPIKYIQDSAVMYVQ